MSSSINHLQSAHHSHIFLFSSILQVGSITHLIQAARPHQQAAAPPPLAIDPSNSGRLGLVIDCRLEHAQLCVHPALAIVKCVSSHVHTGIDITQTTVGDLSCRDPSTKILLSREPRLPAATATATPAPASSTLSPRQQMVTTRNQSTKNLDAHEWWVQKSTSCGQARDRAREPRRSWPLLIAAVHVGNCVQMRWLICSARCAPEFTAIAS